MLAHEAFKQRCREDLDAARARVTSASAGVGTLALYNQAELLLRDAGARASLLSEVHPDADFRAAAEECTKEVERVAQEVLMDRDLYEAVAAVAEEGLDAGARRFRAHALRDFRRAGVDKDSATRERLKQLKEEMVDAGLAFDRTLREFSEFQKHGLFDEATARRYREGVLVPGGSRDAADLVHDFLGRPYDFEAYRRWLEQS